MSVMVAVTQTSDGGCPAEEREQTLVREFFESFGRERGYFVDVGANHPQRGNQTWHLERLGWQGVLIEPQPDLAAMARETRTASVFNVACSSPQNAGRVVSLHVAGHNGALSSLHPDRMAAGAKPERTIGVAARTLDDILAETAAPAPIDFLSVDVEGHEIETLSGFDFARWRPHLVLLEDHVGDLSRHRFMRSRGYCLVRRTGWNGWYVRADNPVSFG